MICHCTLGGTEACRYCSRNDTVHIPTVWIPELMNLDLPSVTTWSDGEEQFIDGSGI